MDAGLVGRAGVAHADRSATAHGRDHARRSRGGADRRHLLITRPGRYTIADAPSAPPRVLIHGRTKRRRRRLPARHAAAAGGRSRRAGDSRGTENPARRWTVAEPAARVGISRAAFAARLSALVGELALTFLTGWRIALAAELLRDAETTVAAVAREVGYEDPFAFSVAFKRTPSGSLRPRERAPSRQPDGQ
ncbi:helix-turn-helix transcriptional regulator [Streptomyces sp. NRAIS4]